MEAQQDSRKFPANTYSRSFAQILDRLGVSLAVTTYHAGMLVVLRAEAGGEKLNAQYRDFAKPMGLAQRNGRLAMATNVGVWEFHNLPVVGRKFDPPCDACFLPRNYHVTGDLMTHEMAFEGPNLIVVNTRFSCLASVGGGPSFESCWKPPFISAMALEDRCHLNGIGLRDGEIRYATALGETDTPGGWRENRRSGGIIMDVLNDQIIARGLSMPHSPRWFQNRLWILESGNNGIGVVDEGSGHYQEVCRLPGFTRGLDFAGRYAFVGISQQRKSSVAGGADIPEVPPDDRLGGVWIVDTATGQIAGDFNFVDSVHEIFDVQVLSGMRWPEILNNDHARLADSYEIPRE